jgi:hypothetical protein
MKRALFLPLRLISSTNVAKNNLKEDAHTPAMLHL